MKTRTRLSRLLWFDARVRGGHRPGAADLAAHFGVSARTARRDIACLRDRVQAPLLPRRARKGYEYSTLDFHLPSSFFRKDELVALLLAERLVRELRHPRGEEAEAVAACVTEVFRRTPLLAQAGEAISFGWAGDGNPSEAMFLDLLRGVMQGRSVILRYSPPGEDDACEREVEPVRLHCHMGCWYVLGRSRAETGVRLFALSRVRAVVVTGRTFDRRAAAPDAEACLRRVFGLVRSGRIRNARVRFGPRTASDAAGRTWHPDQRTQFGFDGSAIVDIPAIRFAELVGLLLHYGGDARVVAPREAGEVAETEAARVAALDATPIIAGSASGRRARPS